MTAAVPSGYTSARRLLVVLGLVSMVNFIDRQLLSILLEDVKADLRVSDTAMGLLTGTVFGLCYVAASVPVARYADRHDRRSVLAVCLTLWSVATAACGLAQNFVQLVLARCTVALGESAAMPISQSLLADAYPPHRRATVFGIIMSAAAIGVSLGLYMGGAIAERYDWRVAFLAMGIPGILIAIVLHLYVTEPKREPAIDDANSLHAATLRSLITGTDMQLLLLVSGLAGYFTYATGAWMPAYFIRRFGLSTSEVGFGVGATLMIGQGTGHIVAGYVSDLAARRDARWYAWLPAAGKLAVIPCGIAALYLPGALACLVAFGAMQFFHSGWLAPTYALAYRMVPINARASVSALLTSASVLVGLGIGPLSVGVLNDLLAPRYGALAVRLSLTIVVGSCFLIVLLYMLIARRMGSEHVSAGASVKASR